MKRALFLLIGVLLLSGQASAADAPPAAEAPAFAPPYRATQPLASFLVFTAVPRPDVPDGQIHWTDAEVPGIDVLGPDGDLYNMCPEGGQAWTLQGGDPYGGGTFVAIECGGRAQGWQMLAFHLCAVDIQASIDSSNRVYTPVAAGAHVARECGHTHLSLGYWADESNQLPLTCPQWYVQGRYWVNAACLIQAGGLPPIAPFHLTLSDDWELRYLEPKRLDFLRHIALLGLGVALCLYVVFAFFRAPKKLEATETEPEKPAPGLAPAPQALLKTGIWLGGLALAILISAGPVWPISGATLSGYTTDPARYQSFASAVGYGDWELLRAFYIVAVPRDATGAPVAAGEPGKVFPPEAAAAIPFGETNAETWGAVDPTQPGPYGQYRAWEAVTQRWPVSWYERNVLGLDISREAQHQRDGLTVMATALNLRAEDLYGSSAGAVGRTQILPGHFAPGALCGSLPGKDVWNDRLAVAECTTRYLTVSGCWGSWWANGDVWTALCGYNPGAWNSASDQWYWNVLQDRMTRLTAAAAQIGLRETLTETITGPLTGSEINVSTPVLGLLVTQALLQNGVSAYHLPGPLTDWVARAAPALANYHSQVHGLYRLFRAWTLIYYSPEDVLAMGVQL